MTTLKEYLEKLMAVANGGHDPEFAKSMKGASGHQITSAMDARRKSLKKFLDHHTCTGVQNGVPVWRRLPSFYKTKYLPRECRARGCR